MLASSSASEQWPHGWLQPQWPAPPHVHAVFTTRVGGVSEAPFDRLNLGNHVKDLPAHVATNRDLLQNALAQHSPGLSLQYLRQVHGTQVHAWDPVSMRSSDTLEADACGTEMAQCACVVLVADCVPVLFTDHAGKRVAAAHAGWRGLQSGVLEETLKRFWPLRQTTSADTAISMEEDAVDVSQVLAWIGPCIGPDAFEVGAEVREAFVSQDPAWDKAFVPGSTTGKFLANLPLLTRWRLEKAGVTACYGNDGSVAWCTATQASQFFSHRRDAARLGSTGRMAAVIWKSASG